VPFGSRALTSPIPDASGSGVDGVQGLVSASMIETQVVGGSYSSKNYHGFDCSG